MGLIATALGAVSGVLADQWKEYFVCESMPANVLVRRGVKKNNKGNNKGNDNIISNGSVIVVNEGQCAMIVEQGKIVEFTAEPGAFTFDSSSEPSIFTGKFGENLLGIFQTLGKRISFAGEAANDQRVYYFNTKEITDNKFGTPNPIPFRAVDRNIGLDIDVLLRCSGTYSYHLVDPMTFYVKVCGNVTSDYTRDMLDAQLKAEFISKLHEGIGMLSTLEIRPSQLPAYNANLEKAMKDALTAEWTEGRGIEVYNVDLTSVTLPDEYQAMIAKAQQQAMYKDPTMAMAMLAGSQGEAMVDAANNANGAVNGFIGLNMAGGNNAASFAQYFAQMAAAQNAAAPAAAPAAGWTCPKCGNVNTGNFCSNCGTAKPAAGWTCPKCGTVNEGNFCSNCGSGRA